MTSHKPFVGRVRVRPSHSGRNSPHLVTVRWPARPRPRSTHASTSPQPHRGVVGLRHGSGLLRALTHFSAAWVVSLALMLAAVVMALAKHLPLHDPDNGLPGYIRMPVIVLAAVALDIVPRAVWRSARGHGPIRSVTAEVVQERWPASHRWFAGLGVAAWYLSYAAFRNVKSMAPLVNDRLFDGDLARFDRMLFAGSDPGVLLHNLLGTGLAAHVLSAVYMVWIVLIPASIGIALAWTRSTLAGVWYVTALTFDWALGAALYVAVPTVGPVYSNPAEYVGLPETYVSRLQHSMWADRVAVLGDPAHSGLQTIAAFASLHVGIMVTICLLLEFIKAARWMRTAAWLFLGMTCLATVYLGWHFVADVICGALLGAVAIWLSAVTTGNHVGLRPRLRHMAEQTPALAGSSPLA